MSKKAKLSQLHRELSDKPKVEPKVESKKEKTKPSGVNPIRGERGDFLKVTITLPPSTLCDLKKLGIDRKLRGEKDTDVSSLIRESLKTFLESQE
jgi:hypothetical protein